MPNADPRAALKDLAAALDPGHFTTEPATDAGVLCLHVANRHAQISEYIYTDGLSYLWPWGQPIAAVGNLQAAASKIAAVLATTPEPAHG